MENSPPPDHACTFVGHPFYTPDVQRIRVSLDGVEDVDNVIEYCASKGWAKVHVRGADGEKLGGNGSGWKTRTRRCKIVVWWNDQEPPAGALVADTRTVVIGA